MAYTDSSLISKTKISPNHYNGRNAIMGAVPHVYVGYASMDDCAAWFGKTASNASCNYYIDKNGKIILIVHEKDGAWTTSSYICDMNHVTIECASASTHPYSMTEETYNALVKLVADIYKRNGIKECKWDQSKAYDSTIGYIPMHRNYKNKACPGDWLVNNKYKTGDFCKAVNKILNAKEGEKEMPKGPKQEPGKPLNDAGVYYKAHCQTLAWCDEVHDGQIAGTVGYAKRLEAIHIKMPEGMNLKVKAHIQRKRWEKYEGNELIIGTTGQGLRLEMIEMEAEGIPEGKEFQYQVHVQGIGWMDWAKNGEPTGTVNQSKRIEAVRIAIVDK